MQIAIIGDGGWGTALALALHTNGHSVRVWGPFADSLERIRITRENERFLPGVKLPEALIWTDDRAGAVAGAAAVVLAVPTRFFRDVMTSFTGLIPPGALCVSVAKGFDPVTRERMTVVAEAALGHAPVAALSGPSHAEEVARGVPTAVVIACADLTRAERLQQLFSHGRLRCYTSNDVPGVELGGALKNVIALAVGISDGLGFGANTRAALITRGLAEITRIGVALGAQPATFAGLSGIGDLVVTCTSRLSRNFCVGERLGKGERLDDILGGMSQVAEGVTTSRSALTLARQAGVSAPIIEAVCGVLYDGISPASAVEALMTRGLRPEKG
ncbi:MAG: NAD(P)H-dependent glycerol-3-phosphate dehydrogenase [bacterium]